MGNIVGCKAATYGGGIFNEDGTVIVNGGSIKDCTAGENGGGIYGYSDFTMNGGSIENCVATEYGGGVFNLGSNFKMTGGSIKIAPQRTIRVQMLIILQMAAQHTPMAV